MSRKQAFVLVFYICVPWFCLHICVSWFGFNSWYH